MGERIRCRKCGDILQSKYRHDFKMCRCGSCYIDGGDDYCRIGGDKKDIEWLDRRIEKKKLNSNWYTKGKFERKTCRIIDNENEFLYSKGRYLTKIKEKDLPEDYTKFKSRTIWYTIGYIKTSGVKDLYYTYVKENHLFKDDYLYISYDKKIKESKDKYGCEEIKNYDFLFCGSDILKVLFAIEKNSNIDTKKIRNKIKEKFEWWKENEQNDYKRWFKGKEVTDIFEYYNGV